ncbi:MAG TPA: glycerate kinase [Arachnia sp.]|nr:glycerate kinase [Arachnia sp.]HMT87184.1 glycerate kinase [Arachnia sp.]
MRVVVTCDAIAGLDARRASETIARAFGDAGAQVAVAVLGEGGASLAEAVAPFPGVALIRPESGADLGKRLARLAREGGHSERLVIDLTATDIADLGASFLDAFAGSPAEALVVARAGLARAGLVAVVAADQVERPLTGLSGLASTAGRDAGLDLSQVLAADARAGEWLTALGLTDRPGAGAAGGLGVLLQHLGAEVTDGLTFTAELLRLAETMRRADLVVTGAHCLDFHAVGGPLVKRVAAMGEEALRPVVAVAGRNFVSARELRLVGIESAAALVPAGSPEEPTVQDLERVARQLAATWTW